MKVDLLINKVYPLSPEFYSGRFMFMCSPLRRYPELVPVLQRIFIF